MTLAPATDHPRGTPAPSWHPVGIVIAAPPRRGVCWAVNLAVVLVVAGAGWLLGWVWALVFGSGVAAWELTGLVRTGRSVGHRVAGLRVVDKTTGMPGTPRALLGRRCVSADLRRGRDPLRLVPRSLPGPVPPPPPPPPTPARVGLFALVGDDGSRVVVVTPTLVGRGASDPSGRYATVTIPDVSRTLSRNHAVLEPAPDGLRVTDVGSGNGTAVAGPNGLRTIVKYQTVTVGAGAQLLLGTRFFEVTHESERP